MIRARIANFLQSYLQPGGTSAAVRGLSRALVRLGWEVVIYCGGGGGEPSDQEEIPGLRVVRYCARSRNPFEVDRKLLLRLAGNQDKVDLLVIHGMFNPLNVSVARAARRAGIPYLACPHDPYHTALLRKGRWRKLLYGCLYERPLLKGACGVQLLTDRHERLLLAYGVRTPVIVVPNGFDADEVSRLDLARVDQPGRANQGIRILYLGRLDMYNKGLDLLLKGIAIGLHRANLPATLRLDLVGADWGDQARLELLATRLGIAQNVRFRGRISDRSQWNIISSYDLLILPSRWDGFGLVILEAMAVGKPVIVSVEAGISSYVEAAQCGYLVQPNCASIWEGLMRAFQTRDQWQAMGRRGKEFAYQHLTWDKAGERAICCYEGIMNQAKKGSMIDAPLCAQPQAPISQTPAPP
jgi:glycosyltransferase involved in cell wall biosynthesis